MKQSLRLRAEALLSADGPQNVDVSSAQEILHELLVHQVELEMQNQELQQARNQALEARESYRLLFEMAPCGYIVFDRSGVVLDVNKAAEAILNTTRQRLLNRPIMMHVLAKDHTKLFNSMERAFADGGVKSTELSVQYHDEPVRSVRLLFRAVEDGAGACRCLCALEDMTPLRDKDRALAEAGQARRKVDELEAANEWLRHVDEAKSDFLNAVSHELRTPLTSILGFAKIIHRDFMKHCTDAAGDAPRFGGKGATILNNLAIIDKEGKRLKSLIDDLLDLEKIESGNTAWSDALTDLPSLVEEAVSVLRGLFVEKPLVAVRLEAQPGVPPVSADPRRLEQVVINLLTNAFKHTEDGEVVVWVCSPDPRSVVMRVEDSGTGIDRDNLLKIFDKFYQSEQLRQGAPHGTGLGLPISKMIIEHYDGVIWAESTAGKGTVVTVELPAEAPRPEQKKTR